MEVDADLVERAGRVLGDRPLVLCGFMGVGKSSIGRRLAELFGRSFVDLDAVVAERLGRPIPELFADGDEALFRSTEAAATADAVLRRPAAVLALGGGALEDPATRALVVDRALVVLLDQTWEQLAAALPNLRRGRPVLAGRSDEEVHRLFLERAPNYAVAHVRVPMTRSGVGAAVGAVLAHLATDAGARP